VMKGFPILCRCKLFHFWPLVLFFCHVSVTTMDDFTYPSPQWIAVGLRWLRARDGSTNIRTNHHKNLCN
jgi:hypothetical protein